MALTCKGALPIHVQLVLQDLECFSPELFTLAVSPQVAPKHGIIPSQVQDLAFAFVALHEVPADLACQDRSER